MISSTRKNKRKHAISYLTQAEESAETRWGKGQTQGRNLFQSY